MRVGFYKQDLEMVVGDYDVDDEDYIEEIAKDFASENHQIDEASDMKFTVYVQGDNGSIYEVKFYTEYDPVFEIDNVEKLS